MKAAVGRHARAGTHGRGFVDLAVGEENRIPVVRNLGLQVSSRLERLGQATDSHRLARLFEDKKSAAWPCCPTEVLCQLVRKFGRRPFRKEQWSRLEQRVFSARAHVSLDAFEAKASPMAASSVDFSAFNASNFARIIRHAAMSFSSSNSCSRRSLAKRSPRWSKTSTDA